MSSSSSNSLDILEEVLPPWEICLPITTPLQRRTWAEFWKAPTRLLVGLRKLECPFSSAHLFQNCLFWRLATESGDQPTHILTETDVDPANPKFWQAWFIANGLLTMQVQDLKDNIYLDYLLFQRTGGTKATVITNKHQLEAAKLKIEAQYNLVQQQQKEAKVQEEAKLQEEAEVESLRLMNLFSEHLQKQSTSKTAKMKLAEGKPDVRVCKLLRAQGLKVFYYMPDWYLAIRSKRVPEKRKANALPPLF